MRKITFFVAIMLQVCPVWAQSPLDSIQATYNNLNTGNIPTGILWDRALYVPGLHPNPNNFQGSASSELGDKDKFDEFLELMHMAAYDDSLAMRPDTFYNRRSTLLNQFYQAQTDPQGIQTIPISVMDYRYQRIDSAAIFEGKIGFDTATEKYFDVAGQNPYLDKKLFTAALGVYMVNPLNLSYSGLRGINYAINYTINFNLPRNLYVKNHDETPNHIAVDFADGNGYQRMGFDQTEKITYSTDISSPLTEGLGERKIIKVRLHYGTYILTANVKLVIGLTTKIPDAILTNRDLTLTNTPCKVPFEGREAEARAYVLYGSDPQGNRKIDKPVIFIEGFDSGQDDFGNQTWAGFSTGVFKTGDHDDLLPQLNKLPHLTDSLRAHGYDVLVVDFKSGVADMRENGAFVIKLIQWVNEQVAINGSDEQLVVAGASMGGVIARYALLKMEEQDCCHNTRFYATLDSPHKGANIPIGVQLFIRNLGYKTSLKKARKQYESVVRSQAAMQLIQYHVNSTHPTANSVVVNPWANPVGNIAEAIHQDFYGELERMGGQPKNCYKYAIVNGSVTAEPTPISPGDLLVDMALDIDAPKAYPATFDSWHYMGSKVYATNTNSSDVIVRTKGLLSTWIASKMYGIDWATYAVGWVARIPTFGFSDPFFEKRMDELFIANDALALNYTQDRQMRLLDGAPGSSTNTMELLAADMFGLARAVKKSHTFIPSYSALDIDVSYLFNSILANAQTSQLNTPFDNFWFYQPSGSDNIPAPNDRHVEIRPQSIEAFVSEIEKTRYILSTPGVSNLHKNLTSAFNYGKPELPIVQQLDVSQNGLLLINHRSYRYHYSDGRYPTAGTKFTAYTNGSDCRGSWIKINQGGLLQLGDNVGPPNNNIGNLNITKGTFLEIKAGGTLRIYTGSRLLIEEGAELIIHPGAIIELDGERAVLELQGKLTLKQNAVFSPSGSGFVRMAYPFGLSGSTAFNFGNNTEINLSRSDTGHKVLEVVGEALIPSGLSALRIENAKVSLGNNAILVLSSPVSSTEVKYCNLSAAQPYRSVRLQGQPNTTFTNSYFYGGDIQLQALQTVYGNSLSLVGCKFFYPQQIGFYAEGAGVSVENCRFKGGRIGMEMYNATLTSSISNTVLEDQVDVGIKFKGQSAVSLNIQKTDVKRAQAGIVVEDVNLRMSCTRSLDNGYLGLKAIGSYINIANEARNTLTGNQIGILLENATHLRMANGHNHLYNNSLYFIKGSFDNNHLLGSNLSVDISNNNMPGPASALPIHMYTQDNQPVGVHNHNNNNNNMTWACYVQPSPLNEFVLEYPSFRVVNTAGYTNMYYSDAFYDAVGFVSFEDIVNSDLVAVSKLSQLLEMPLSEPTENELILREYGLQMMMTALSNAYEQNLIPLNRALENEAENPYLYMVTDELNQRLLENSGIDQELEYELNIAKAHMYRMAEHYDYAITTLNEAEQTANYEDLIETDYWECICEAEEDLLHEDVSVDEYLDLKLICQNQLLAKKGEDPIVEGITTKAREAFDTGVISEIVPNPALDFIEIKLNEEVKNCTVVLTDITGKQISVKLLRTNELIFRIDLSSVSKGTYMLSLYGKKEFIDSKKVIKL